MSNLRRGRTSAKASKQKQTKDRPAQNWREFLAAPPKVAPSTIGDLCEHWHAGLVAKKSPSARDYLSSIRCHIEPAFGDLACERLTVPYVEAWVASLESYDYSAATVRKAATALTQACDLGVRLGCMAANPLRSLPPSTLPRKQARDPGRSAAEILPLPIVRSLVRDGPPVERVLWGLLLLGGLRIGEASTLQWNDLETRDPLDGFHVRRTWSRKLGEVKTTKAGQDRRVPVHPELRKLLDLARRFGPKLYQRPLSGSDLVVPYRDRRDHVPRRWDGQVARRRFRKALAEMGVASPGGRPHRLHACRHTFVTLCSRAGADKLALHPITHTGPATSLAWETYNHVDWESTCEAVLCLDLDAPPRTARVARGPKDLSGRRAGPRTGR